MVISPQWTRTSAPASTSRPTAALVLATWSWVSERIPSRISRIPRVAGTTGVGCPARRTRWIPQDGEKRTYRHDFRAVAWPRRGRLGRLTDESGRVIAVVAASGWIGAGRRLRTVALGVRPSRPGARPVAIDDR